MKIFCRENTANFKADIRITDDNRLTIHVYEPAGETRTYAEIGKHGQKLESHNTYSVLYKKEGYLIRDLQNKQYRSQIKIVPSNQITMGSRMKFEEVENRYGGVVLMQVDTNTISAGITELQMQLFRVQKANANFYLRPTMTAEYIDLDMDDVFKNGSKRHALWDTYSLTIDGQEYKGGEWTKAPLGQLKMQGREFVEVEVQKYSNGFAEKLVRDGDCEDVFLECTAGIANCQRVKLVNGKGKFRWYNLGYTGEMKIKLGWRWYSGIADVRLAVEE